MQSNNPRVLSLSGSFQIVRDPEAKGAEAGFARAIPEGARTIIVPGRMSQERINYDYSYSSVFPDYHGFVWYYRCFPGVVPAAGERCLLEFERAGYQVDVWLNGCHLGSHRHHEEAFSFDITDILHTDGDNLLAVRCFEPMRDGEPINGIRLRDIPNGSLADGEGQGPQANCIGGILSEVRLKLVPMIRIIDQYISPHVKTGEVTITVSVENAGKTAEEKQVSLLLSEQKSGLGVAEVKKRAVFAPGQTEMVLTTAIPAHRLWELKNPFLYLSTLIVGEDSHTARFGFRELRLENGFFTLNGTRVLLKCAHGTFSAANCIAMKAMGFNAFRSIHRTVDPETMELCDELGFLILQSPITAWGMREHENTFSMVEAYMKNMVKLHRNHPSVGAYYFYNETASRPLIQMAVKLLPELRALDPHNIFLLSSGRWDDDLAVNSASNPGSPTFDVPLGGEGMAELSEKCTDGFTGISVHDAPMGDVHAYASYPMDRTTRDWFRRLGEHTNPVFLSESGIGSQCNPVYGTLNAEALHVLRPGFPQSAPRPDERVTWVLGLPPRKLWEKTENFLDFYGLRELYPFADLLCAEADRLNARQREQAFDLLRANPHLCGFSLTSFGGGNEGMCEGTALGNGIIKEGLAHVLQEGLAPLRFSLFASDRVVYAGAETALEAVLCNEDRLPPGRYPMSLCVDGEAPARLIQKWDAEALYPDAPIGGFAPLAASVFHGSITFEEEGNYHFRARLTAGDMPCGGDLAIRALRIPDRHLVGRRLIGVGLTQALSDFLSKEGAALLPPEKAAETDLLLVGTSPDERTWEMLTAAIKGGATAVFIDPALFGEHPAWLGAIAGEAAVLTRPFNWLYHHDCVHLDHPVFKDITPAGFCDLESYGELYPDAMFEHTRKPALTVSASFRIEGALSTGLTFGEFSFGKGKAVLNCFRLAHALGKHPFADRMLLNIVDHYTKG